MAKIAPDTMLDAALKEPQKAVRAIVCAGAPTTYTAATTTNALADVALAAADLVIGAATAPATGRTLTIAAKAGVPIDTSGTADHVALVTDTGSILQYVTQLSASQAVTAGNTADLAAWTINIAAPT